jgi:hypothetical protein
MPNLDPLVSVTLDSLPTAIPAANLLSPTPSSTTLDLPSIGVNASIKAIKMGMMQVQHAVTVPNEVNLVGWDEESFSYNVCTGQLNWYGADEIFARLHELESGNIIEVHSQSNHHRYFVDEVQSYRADTTSVVEISPVTAGNKLVLIAWGETYDVDQQEYRDYIVIQARQDDASWGNPY